MKRQRALSQCHIAAALVWTLLWVHGTFAASCENSPIIFSYDGSLFTALPGQKPARLASGFQAPSDIAWAPGCSHYAFIDSGSLWVGSRGRQPKRIAVPGTIYENTATGFPGYQWSTNGKEIAITALTRACTHSPGTEASVDQGDTYLARAPEFIVKALTSDCRTHILGWSDNGSRIVLAKEALSPCAVTLPICATANVVALNPLSGFETALINATYLRENNLNDPKLVKWNTESGILYIWSRTSQIGGLGAIVALHVPTEKMLWSIESYGATLLTDGRIANRARKVTNLEKKGFSWEWQYQILEGERIVEKYAPQPRSEGGEPGRISADGRFVWWQPQGSQSKICFGIKDNADIWDQSLPMGFQSEGASWTPSDHLVVQGYKRTGRNSIALGVWLFDPIKRTSAELFESSYPLPSDPYKDFTRYSVVRLPNGKMRILHKPLVLGGWAQ